MTDSERDQIDADAQIFMRTCSEAIQSFRKEVNKEEASEQVKVHREAVITLVDTYLKGICKIYSEQKAIRVKRVVDKKRLGRLEPEGVHTRKSVKTESSEQAHADKPATTSWQDKAASEKASSSTTSPSLDSQPPIVSQDDDEELSPEEMQMFEMENQQMFDEMNSMLSEVKQIEGKVVEIARLQEIFAEKVLEQDKDVDSVADKTVFTTENIKGANEEIREAMKNNAGFRVWILFIIIVLTFSLLFLDWYND